MTYSSYIALRDPMKGWGVGPDREGAQLANLDMIIISRSRRSKSEPKMLPLILNASIHDLFARLTTSIVLPHSYGKGNSNANRDERTVPVRGCFLVTNTTQVG